MGRADARLSAPSVSAEPCVSCGIDW